MEILFAERYRLSRTLGKQKMTDLLAEKVMKDPPCTYFGVDLFRPFLHEEKAHRNQTIWHYIHLSAQPSNPN